MGVGVGVGEFKWVGVCVAVGEFEWVGVGKLFFTNIQTLPIPVAVRSKA